MNTLRLTPKHWRKNSSIKSLSVIGKEWFDKVNGNSYCSVQIDVNDEFSFWLPMTYGYGDYYLQYAFEFLAKHGFVKSKYDRHEIKNTNYRKIENCLKRDVKAWGEKQ